MTIYLKKNKINKNLPKKKKKTTEVQGAVPVSVCRWQQHDFNETDR